MRRIAFALVAMAACADLKSAPETAASSGDASSSSSSSSSGGVTDAGVDPDTGFLPPQPEAAVRPSEPCRPTPPACLDATPASLIEVPTEMTFDKALATATPLDVIQLRGASSIFTDFTLPKDVSLVGCEGAEVRANVRLGGGVQHVSNLSFVGRTVTISYTGSYSFQRDRFSANLLSTDSSASILISTIGSAFGTEISVAFDDTSFMGRTRGIDLVSNDNAGPKGVQLTVRNGVFSRVAAPIRMEGKDIHRTITGAIVSSTFYDFDTAISLVNLDAAAENVDITSSLFAKGTSAVGGTVGNTYRWNYSFAWNVPNPLAIAPKGTPLLITDADPRFVDAEKDDLRLQSGSRVVNRIPSVYTLPATDFIGCPRPAALAADPGAFESQP